jgi:hypothetical protein
MGRIVTIDIDDLRKLMREEMFTAISEVVGSLKEGEVLISTAELERNRQLQKRFEVEEDVYLNGKEVAAILGCTSGQITKLKQKGVLEPTYPYRNGETKGAPRYSKRRLMEMLKQGTVRAYNKM